MSELVALCFDADASPSIRFAAPQPTDASPPQDRPVALYGWGVGWYPSSERGAAVLKDPTSSGDVAVNDVLRDWNRFRSTVFLCHLRGHQRQRNQEDAQPFVRSYGGRQWIFAHDGDLAPDWAKRLPLPDDPAFEPLGRTDSEHAFCLLLSRFRAAHHRSIADVAPDELRAWMAALNQGGQLNALLTDGEHIAVYRDAGGKGDLYWTRRIPPHASTELSSHGVQIRLDAPQDPNRTCLVFSSVPLSDDAWRATSPGELLILRRGSILWSSAPAHAAASTRFATPDGVLTVGGLVEAGHQSAAAEPLRAPMVSPTQNSAGRTLTVLHETIYDYDQPVERSTHRLLLRPIEDRAQHLLDFSIEIDPETPRNQYEDVFGNEAIGLEIKAPYQHLRITSRATVHVVSAQTLEQRAAHRRHVIPLVWMPWQRQMLSTYLLPHELPESQLQELSEFAMSFVERNDYDLVGTLLDLNETIHRDFEYVSGSTTVATTAFEVYESRRGVCQDFANLMICVARLLHVPARYRMGYIFTGTDYENKIQSDASHAWAELYLPQVGWHGLDPTNGIQVGSNHVRVASGRNYRDATPTSGTIYRGGGTETLTISVRVEEIPPPA